MNDEKYWSNLIIDALISKGEYNFLDFKLRLSDDNNRLKEHINAFGNLERGGCFVFGVDKFKPVGLQESDDEIIKKVTNLAVDTQDPALHVKAFPLTIGRTHLLCVHILSGTTKPVFIKDRAPLGGHGCYKRTGSSTVPIPTQEIRDILATSDDIYYDESPVNVTDLNLLNIEQFKDVLPKFDGDIYSDKVTAVLKDYKILSNAHAMIQPTLAGWLCFSDDPQAIRAFRNAYIEIQIFQGAARNNPIKKYDIKGNLPAQIEQAIEILKQNIWTVPTITGVIREDIPAYSEVALREIITNCLVHRDYRLMHQPTKIAMFDNRIEVENPGGLMPGLTTMNIVHKRDWRNPLIAELMRKFGYGEMDGQGIDRLYASALQIKIPPPVFIDRHKSFLVTLSAPKAYEDFSVEEKHLMVMVLAIMHETFGNESVRDCFGISAVQASTLIRSMIADMIIQPSGKSRKFARYTLSDKVRAQVFGL